MEVRHWYTPDTNFETFLKVYYDRCTIYHSFNLQALLLVSISYGHTDVFNFLLNRTRNCPYSLDFPQIFREAFSYVRADYLRTLLKDERFDVTELTHNFVSVAGRLPKYEDLLPVFIEDSRFDMTEALTHACSRGKYKFFHELLSHKRVEVSNEHLIVAINKNRSYAIECLLQDPRIDPTHIFACGKINTPKAETLKLLVDDPRVDILAGDQYPLRQATFLGHCELVFELLQDPRTDVLKFVEGEPSRMTIRIVKALVENPRARVSKMFGSNKEDKKRIFTSRMACKLIAEEIRRIQLEKSLAVAFVFKQVGQGWVDVGEPTIMRMTAL